MALWIVLGLVVLLVGSVIWMYNRLVTLRQRTENAWSQIDVQLKRRHDLIPNLVETAKGYLEHEQETLTKVTEARQQAVDAEGLQDQAEAENMLTGALRSLFAVSENYPDLKADQNMMELQEELTNTENKISFARQHYNDVTMDYNETQKQFPMNVIAGQFDFNERDYFEIEDPAEKEVPEVDFGE